MTTLDGKKHAVVLSGGGANGAFEVGVMKALFGGQSPATDYQPLKADIFAGTSVGAFNAAVMASQPDASHIDTAAYLEDIWLNRVADRTGQCGNGVFRFRGGLSDVIDPECLTDHPGKVMVQLARDGAYLVKDFFRRGRKFLFRASGNVEYRALELFNLSSFVSTEPLRRLIRDTVSLAGIRASDKALRIVATNWETGEARVFHKDHMVDEVGYDAIHASTAIPGFFSHVNVSGVPYVDGGLVMNTPLLPAIEAGADVVHMIYLDPDVKNIPLERLENTLDTMDRMLTVQFAMNINADIEKANCINAGLDVIERAALNEPLDDGDVASFVKAAALIKRRLDQGGIHKKIQIHRYHPRDDLSGVLGLLKFDRDRIEGLIERGFKDAVSHDCVASGCCLPREDVTAFPVAQVANQTHRLKAESPF